MPKRETRRDDVRTWGTGNEPSKPILTETDLINALNYYKNTGYDFAWLTQFMTAYGFTASDIEAVKQAKTSVAKTTLALSHLWNRNLLPLDGAYEKRLITTVKALIDTAKLIAEAPRGEVSYKRDGTVDRYIADIENVVDLIAYTTIPLNVQLDLSRLSNADKSKLRSFYEPKLEEIRAVLNGSDKELVEAYSTTTANLTRVGELYAAIVGVDFKVARKVEAPRIEVKAKRTFKGRKPRAPKFNKLKYAATSDELGLKSIAPIAVHSATTLITYNAKYGSVSVYQAQEGKTLAFKRTSLTNFDEKKSYSKRSSRAKGLVGVLQSGKKREIIKAIEDVNSKPSPATSVMNEHTILVAAF